MQQLDLNRFELTGILGTGADYEVRSAVDRESQSQVVLKRPVPQAIRNLMHGPVETRTDRTIQAYEEIGANLAHLSPIVGYTERANHDEYYGDSFRQEYRVLVMERAAGIPLVGDARSRILRVPIGLGQNLFALYPLGHSNDKVAFTVHQQLLDVEEAFAKIGYLLLDLSPQNVYYQPESDRITVIDSGELIRNGEQADSRHRIHRDFHDFFLEILKFYITAQYPPADVQLYRDPHNLRPVLNFEQELDEIAGAFSGVVDSSRESALSMISKVRNRVYSDFTEFRLDLSSYLNDVRARNQKLPDPSEARKAWKGALELLRAEHWGRYIFDHQTALARFDGLS